MTLGLGVHGKDAKRLLPVEHPTPNAFVRGKQGWSLGRMEEEAKLPLLHPTQNQPFTTSTKAFMGLGLSDIAIAIA